MLSLNYDYLDGLMMPSDTPIDMAYTDILSNIVCGNKTSNASYCRLC